MKATNNGPVEIALPLESKKRLNEFRRQLASDVTKVQFDKPVLRVLEKYVRNPKQLSKIRRYLNQLKDADGNLFSRSLKNSEQLDAQIRNFQGNDHTSFRWNQYYNQALTKMKEEYSAFNLAPLSYSCDDDIINAIPKLDTHSGWTYILTGRKHKGENLDGIYAKFTAEATVACHEGSFNKPILPGVRTQGSGEFDEFGNMTNTCKHKTRLVSMVDLIQIIAELRFAKPFQAIIGGQSFYAGGKSPNEISKIINNMRANYSEYVCLDYSSYDQTISSWLIEDAFDVIRCAFREFTCEESMLWDVVVHDLIHKTFISKEGVVHSDKGVPSGSMFTQIIDSIVNRLMITTYLLSKGINGSMIIMGDDNLLYYNIPVDFSSDKNIKSDLASYLTKNFGIKCNEDKSSYGTRFNDPEFLSREWRVGGQWRHPNILVSKLLFSERFRHYDEQSTPELVVYSYILAYGLGMFELLDVERFLMENQFSPYDLAKMDSRNLPGYLRYQYHNVREIPTGMVA